MQISERRQSCYKRKLFFIGALQSHIWIQQVYRQARKLPSCDQVDSFNAPFFSFSDVILFDFYAPFQIPLFTHYNHKISKIRYTI